MCVFVCDAAEMGHKGCQDPWKHCHWHNHLTKANDVLIKTHAIKLGRLLDSFAAIWFKAGAMVMATYKASPTWIESHAVPARGCESKPRNLTRKNKLTWLPALKGVNYIVICACLCMCSHNDTECKIEYVCMYVCTTWAESWFRWRWRGGCRE